MEEHGVIPDVIDSVPKDVVDVSWPSGVKAEMGNILTPTQVQNPPTVTYPVEAGAYYTVVMTDPDAPSRKEPKFREWHHWMVINVPGNEVSKGTTNSEYVGAGPPPNTGLHRYIILVYKQPSGKMTNCSDDYRKKTGEGRGGWNARKFAADNSLGEPVAGNFFQAEFDDYVPKLYEEMASNK